MSMVKLVCAVAGADLVFVVSVSSDAAVRTLQELVFSAIRRSAEVTYHARQLTLYLTASENGEGAANDSTTRKLLRMGILSPRYQELHPSWSLSDAAAFGSAFEAFQENRIHVVLVPPCFTFADSRVHQSPQTEQCTMPGSTHPHRLQRWTQINNLIARREVHWTAFAPVVLRGLGPYAQEIRPIPPGDFQTLMEVLQWTLLSFNMTLLDWNDEAEAKNVHVIAPVLWAVVHLVPGLQVLIDAELKGTRLGVTGRFDFVLVRGATRVCIVQPKEERFNEGTVDALLGCEIAADLGDSHETHAVVTNGEKWVFLKSLDTKILCDESNMLTFGGDGLPDAEYLRKITGKLHSMLASV